MSANTCCILVCVQLILSLCVNWINIHSQRIYCNIIESVAESVVIVHLESFVITNTQEIVMGTYIAQNDLEPFGLWERL